jgi:uncharacterized protein (TIGR02266 family)
LNDRLHDRVPLSFEVEYRTAGAFLVAYTSNLSKGGLFIETDHPLAVGTDLLLRFTIPAHGPIEVHGVVAWIRATVVDGKPPGMGVEFEQLDARHGEIIDAIVGTFQGLRILVIARAVQARAQVSRSIRSVLSTAEVLEAHGSESVEAMLALEPDLVVLDLDEEGDGEGLYALRLAKSSRQIPVIAAARDELTRQRAHEIGADETLSTPLHLPDLQAAIVRALARPLRVG